MLAHDFAPGPSGVSREGLKRHSGRKLDFAFVVHRNVFNFSLFPLHFGRLQLV